jgi:hypothetical protein
MEKWEKGKWQFFAVLLSFAWPMNLGRPTDSRCESFAGAGEGLCMANEPRPTNGRPEIRGETPPHRLNIYANINNSFPFLPFPLLTQRVTAIG